MGRNTIRAIGLPLEDRSRLTQAEIWDRVVTEAKLAGVVGIRYHEEQHIFRKKSEAEQLAVLDKIHSVIQISTFATCTGYIEL